MDTETLIGKLNDVFCENNKTEKRYSKIWLSEADFGGLYKSDLFVLNIKAEHQIDSCMAEIHSIIALLSEKAREELKSIWRVAVYNANEQVHCWSGDLMVYDIEKSCLEE
jgi:hypothetical protein